MDKISRYILDLGGDDADLRSVMAGVKSRFASDVADLKRTGDKLDLFGAITDNVPKVQAALDKAKASVKAFSDQIDAIKGKGETPTKALTDGLAQAETAAKKAGAELARQQQQLATLGNQLQKAGLDTNNLSAAQTRLEGATKAASAAAEVHAAKQNLSLVTLKDTEAQSAKLRASFDLLKNSGTLSATETAAAQKLLNAELKTLSDSVSKTGTSFASLKADALDSISPFKGQVLAIIGALGTAAATFASVTAAVREYRQTLAEASVGTDLAKESVGGLGKEAQDLSTEIGVNVNDAVRGLFSLLRAGVGEDNAIETLRIAGEAAKASMSDLGTGVKIAKLLLNDFKVAPDDLGHAFDVLSASVGKTKEGFEAFAEFAGPLLAVSRSTGTGLEDLVQVLKAMQRGGIEAGQAMGDLTKFIVALNTDKARQGLIELGIDATDLTGIFNGLREKGATLQNVIDLTGISKKSAAAIAALINEGIKPLGDATDTVAKKTEKLSATQKEISERFHATLDVTKIKLGELVAPTGAATIALTALLKVFNELADEATASRFVKNFSALVNSNQFTAIFRVVTGLVELKQRYDAIADGAAKAAKGSQEFHGGLVDGTASVQKASADLKNYSELLLKNAQALLQNVDAEVRASEDRAKRVIDAIELVAGAHRRQSADDLRADEEARVSAHVTITLERDKIAVITQAIEARQREGISAKEAAAQILLVKQKEAADELAILTEKLAKINELADKALAARKDAVGKNQVDQRAAAADEIAQRTDLTTKIVALYQKQYDSLKAQARAAQDKVNAIDAERISFQEDIEAKIRGLRSGGLSDAERYGQQLRDIDKLTSDARTAIAEGDFKLAKKLTDDAIKTAENLKGVVNADGVVVISNFQAQETAVGKIKTVADQYNKALKDQADSSKDGAEAAKEQLKTVGKVLEDYAKRLNDLRKDSESAIQLRVADEIAGLDKASQKIDELRAKAEAPMRLQVDGPSGGGGGSTPELDRGFARGGPVWKQYAQQFAAGGFARPNWSKVPGSGNSDTVPAALQVGSFVMRKAAVAKYGDALMSKMARGYAQGGWVGFGTGSGLQQFSNNAPVSQVAADLKQFFRDSGKKLTAEEINKLGQYLTSLPAADQSRLQSEIAAGGTNELIAQNEIAEGAATQARGPVKTIAPDDVSPVPSAGDAIQYAQFVEQYLRFGNVFDLVKRQLGTFINQVTRDPANTALIQAMIKTARASASNAYLQDFHVGTGFGAQIPGRSAQIPDWYDFLAQLHNAGNPLHPGIKFGTTKHGFAGGGSVGDIVPAMLTPGEHVFSPQAVKMWGGGLLDRMNRLAFDPPAMPRYFASGGFVPGAAVSERGTASIGGVTNNITINTPYPAHDPKTIRMLRAEFAKIDNRSGVKPIRK